MGSLDAFGKFNLHASLRFVQSNLSGSNTVEKELASWERSFQRASELLYYATDGQHQLGRIWVWPDNTFGSVADLWLEHTSGQSSSTGARIWLAGTHVILKSDERTHPFVILHELGHYLYGLRDEYDDEAGDPAECIGRDTDGKLPGACIMEGRDADGDSYDASGPLGVLQLGDVTDFCVACNHDKGSAGATCGGGFTSFDDTDGDTVQSTQNHESCWETMVGSYPSLSLPGVLPVPTAPPDNIDWRIGMEEIRCVCVLDRSMSMLSAPDIADLTEDAAVSLADLLPDGTRAGFVAYDGTAHALPASGLPPPLNDAFRRRVREFYGGITPGAGSAMGDGLLAALQMFLAAPDFASTQVIFLVSGSQTNGALDPLTLLPLLRNRAIRVYGFGVGPRADMDNIIALSEGTGGSWWRLPYSHTSPYPFRTVESAVGEIVEQLVDGGIITAGDVGRQDSHPGMPDVVGDDEEVFVEEGVQELRIAAFPHRGESANLKVTSPGGEVFELSADGKGPLRPLKINVPEPESGAWRVELPRSGDRARLPVKWNASARGGNARLTVAVPARVPAKSEVSIRVQLTAGYLVTGLSIRMDVVDPKGGVTRLKTPVEDNEPGVYIAKFKPKDEGAYSVRATVDSRKGATFSRLCDCGSPDSDEKPPRVVRHAERAFNVGPPLERARFEPSVLKKRGRHRLALSLGGVPWTPGSSRVALGPGVRILDELPSLPRDDTVTLLVEVTDAATPGTRDGIVFTGSQRYTIEDAVELDVDEPEEVEGKVERSVLPGRYLATIFDRYRRGQDGTQGGARPRKDAPELPIDDDADDAGPPDATL